MNEDADKLLAEGDPSDPQLRRLRREMEEVNKLFDEFEKRARAEGNLNTNNFDFEILRRKDKKFWSWLENNIAIGKSLRCPPAYTYH